MAARFVSGLCYGLIRNPNPGFIGFFIPGGESGRIATSVTRANMLFRRLIATLAVALFVAAPAFAADWVVLRLRGNVEVMVEGSWVALKRGDIVGNEQMVRTLADGHAELQRDKEVVTLGSNTEIRIRQDAETGYTTVLQDFGRVEVDAEAKRVKHFEVQTPYLAAVVKGTHFIVNSDTDGASVSVDRGAVSVQSVASERITTIKVGQIATVKRKTDLVVSGLGPWPPVLEPGVTRAGISTAIGGALGSAPPVENVGLDEPQGPAAASPTGGVAIVTASASSNLFTGFAASQPKAAEAEPSPPLNPGIVVIGALLGAALGALGLLVRRGL